MTRDISLIVLGTTTFGCMLFSAGIATKFLRGSPRLFTVMALFTCCWAILLPYYTPQPNAPETFHIPDTFRAVSGFLLVYIGGLLMLEARHRRQSDDHEMIVPWQLAGLALLVFLAAPPLLSQIGYSHPLAEIVIGLLLDLAGVVSIVIGVKELSGPIPWKLLGAIFAVYIGVELSLIASQWTDLGSKGLRVVDHPNFVIAVSILKVVSTIVFGAIVAYEGMDPTIRKLGHLRWILIFFGLDPANRPKTDETIGSLPPVPFPPLYAKNVSLTVTFDLAGRNAEATVARHAIVAHAAELSIDDRTA